MRIVVVHNRYRSAQPSGEDAVVDQEIRMLEAAGHKIIKYERHSDEIHNSRRLKLEVPVRVSWSPADEREFARLLVHANPDIVHVHNTFPLISAAILRSCRRADVPVVATLHNFRHLCAAGTLLRDGRPCHDCVGRLPLPAMVHRCYRDSRAATAPLALSIGLHGLARTWPRGVDRFICMTRFAVDVFAEAGWDPAQFTVKPHFVPDARTQRQGSGEYAMFLGRLFPEKGADVLIDAWSPELGTLLIVGDGDERPRLERAAERHGTSVRFTGAVPRDEAMRLMAGARVLVNSSRCYETFGLSIAEGYAHGVPAIAPDHAGFPEVVEQGVTGELFRPGDSASLRDALVRMMVPATAQAAGVAARRAYEQRYTEARNLAQLEGIYRDVITRRSGAGARPGEAEPALRED